MDFYRNIARMLQALTVRLLDSVRSLLVRSILWIVLPQSLIMIAIIVGSALVYQKVVASLLVDRDRQLALISASRVSQALEDYVLVLESFLDEAYRGDRSPNLNDLHVELPLETLVLFNAGIVVANTSGEILAGSPAGATPVADNVLNEPYFLAIRESRSPSISNVLIDAGNGREIVVIAVPILDSNNVFIGALMGAIHIEGMPLSDQIRRLKAGDEGFAYLVDSHGRVIYHPDPQYLAADFSNRSYVARVIKGESGGGVERLPTGERLVVGFAPIEGNGWGLVVREPWEEVIEPVLIYRSIALLVASIIILMTTWLLLRGVRRITKPINRLCIQTDLLASGETIEPLTESNILELDALEQAFVQMAHQITSYRAGLRRYLSAITHSQEEERRRIARELHDETAQNILAIDRQLELLVSTEENPENRGRLQQLQTLVGETVQGVRLISRNLRPLVLEDLGMIPALEAMISAFDEEDPDVDFRLEVSGQPTCLSDQHELLLYRIAQEALTNSRKHAQASDVCVQLVFEDSAVRLEIRDNGQGFEPPQSFIEFTQSGSYGLMGIQERVWAAGGTLSIVANPGEGTQLTITIPVDKLADSSV